MKKTIAIVIISLLAVAFAIYVDFTHQNNSGDEEIRTYDTGYEEGKSIGYDIGYDDGYNMGYEEGKNLISESEDDATKYAKRFSEWHPEEAMMIIDAYENNEPFLGDSPPSENDYRNAIQSLYHFYEYYYCGMYEDIE